MQRATCHHLAYFWDWRKLIIFDQNRIPESVLAKSHVIETTITGTKFYEYARAPNPDGPFLILRRIESTPPPFTQLQPLSTETRHHLEIFMRNTVLTPENQDYLNNLIAGGVGSESFKKPVFKLCRNSDDNLEEGINIISI
jgi:hypothetical protein